KKSNTLCQKHFLLSVVQKIKYSLPKTLPALSFVNFQPQSSQSSQREVKLRKREDGQLPY
ncbi:MAG: hypothetical protein ACOYL1_06305, partial [Chlamydiia bacterium]